MSWPAIKIVSYQTRERTYIYSIRGRHGDAASNVQMKRKRWTWNINISAIAILFWWSQQQFSAEELTRKKKKEQCSNHELVVEPLTQCPTATESAVKGLDFYMVSLCQYILYKTWNNESPWTLLFSTGHILYRRGRLSLYNSPLLHTAAVLYPTWYLTWKSTYFPARNLTPFFMSPGRALMVSSSMKFFRPSLFMESEKIK